MGHKNGAGTAKRTVGELVHPRRVASECHRLGPDAVESRIAHRGISAKRLYVNIFRPHLFHCFLHHDI